jgi:hypothetical protein
MVSGPYLYDHLPRRVGLEVRPIVVAARAPRPAACRLHQLA